MIPLLCAAVLNQTVVSMVRLASTYEAIERSLSALEVGVIAASFAILPLLSLILMLPFSKGQNPVWAASIGAAVSFSATVLFWSLDSSFWSLVLINSLLGVGSSAGLAALQLATTQCSGPYHRHLVLGNFSIAISVGQAIGPLLVGMFSGDSNVNQNGALDVAMMISGGALLLSTILMLAAGQARRHPPGDGNNMFAALKTPGLSAVLLASVFSLASNDIMLIYLPLLGVERGHPAAVISMLLVVRAAAVIAARAMYAPLSRGLGTRTMLVMALTTSAVSMIVLSFPMPVWLMAVTIAFTGLGFGLSGISSLALTIEIASRPQRGSTLSLRIASNRVGQFVLPIVIGVGAGLVGAIAAFVILSTGLVTAATLLARTKRPPRN